jgi:hypothetical protein
MLNVEAMMRVKIMVFVSFIAPLPKESVSSSHFLCQYEIREGREKERRNK